MCGSSSFFSSSPIAQREPTNYRYILSTGAERVPSEAFKKTFPNFKPLMCLCNCVFSSISHLCAPARNGLCGCRKSATRIRVTDSLKKLRSVPLCRPAATRSALRKFARRHLDTRAWNKMNMHACVCVCVYWRKTISFRLISSIASDVRSRRVVSRCQWRWARRAPTDRRPKRRG